MGCSVDAPPLVFFRHAEVVLRDKARSGESCECGKEPRLLTTPIYRCGAHEVRGETLKLLAGRELVEVDLIFDLDVHAQWLVPRRHRSTGFSYVPLVHDSRVVAIDGEHILQVSMFVMRDEILEDTFLGRIGKVHCHELILRRVLVRQEVQFRSVVGDAVIMLVSAPKHVRRAYRSHRNGTQITGYKQHVSS